MPIVRKRPIPVAPVKVELDLDKIRAKAKPKPRFSAGRVTIESIKAKLVQAAPAEAEKNADGMSYTDTINRYAAKVRNPLTAIRAKCVECSGGSLKEVTECRVFKCALHPFRMGTNPLHKKTQDRLAKEEHEESGDDQS